MHSLRLFIERAAVPPRHREQTVAHRRFASCAFADAGQSWDAYKSSRNAPTA